MSNNFNDPYAANLVGLWDFLDSGPKADTGLADGIAQNGELEGGAFISGGRLHTDGNCDFFEVKGGNDGPFDLAEGTIAVQFTQDAHVGTSDDTIVNRGEYADRADEGYFEIRVGLHGTVELMHVANGQSVNLSTPPDFFQPGDLIKVTYSWSETEGGTFLVENLTDNTEYTVDVTTTGLTMDVGDNDDESWTFGAREKDDGSYNHYFDGSIDYVAIYNKDILNDGDGIVSGDAGDNDIDLAYTGDPEGDMIDNADALLPGEAPDDDIVDAGAGNDTVEAGLGDDDVYAGSGNDSVLGEAGNDLIYGDSNLPGGPVETATVRESFEWDLGPNAHGFTQNTGSVDVTFSTLQQDAGATSVLATNAQNVSGIVGDGSPIDDTSSLDNVLNGQGNETDLQLEFSEEVTNVSFRVNDIDGDGVVRIQAYDADGNQIELNLTAGSHLTLLDTDAVAGADTADSNGGYLEDTSSEYSVLVDIPGPVSRIVIQHDQDGTNNSGINVTDVYFDVAVGDTGEDGNDTLLGGEGDDTIFGEGGDDQITGGAGADQLSGGDDADTIFGGAGDDVDGGSGGFNADPLLDNDQDVLDLTGQGSFYLDNVTPDSNGNGINGTVVFVDGALNPTGETIEFTEIETIIGDEVNRPPEATDDTGTGDEDTLISGNVLGNDSDPDGDALEVIGNTDPSNGSVVVNADGSYDYTPDANFNGTDSFTYTVSDGNGGTDTATVTITVNAVNDDPVANDDSASTDQGTAVNIPVLDNDTDVDGDTLEVLSAGAPNGSVVIEADGTITYTPDVAFTGTDTITYTVTDGNGGTDTASVTVTVADVIGPVDGTDAGQLMTPGFADIEGDQVDGTDGNDDTIFGNGGDDTIDAGEGDDTVDGGADDDSITGGNGNDSVDGGTGSDTLAGGEGTDTLNGGEGDDDIAVGGNDSATGGTGDDVFTVDATDPATDVNATIDGGSDGTDGNPDGPENGDAGDILDLSDRSEDLTVLLNDPDPESGTVNGLDGDGTPDLTFEEIENIVTGSGDDTIEGDNADGPINVVTNGGNDSVDGGNGDDMIDTGPGNDTVDAGDGSDTVDGGNGDNLIDTSSDDAVPLPDDGFPGYGPVPSIPADSDPNDDRDLVITGSGNDTITTGDDNDTISAGSGNNLIDAGIDDDEITTLFGDDTIVGGEGNDTISSGAGEDLIYGGLDPAVVPFDGTDIPDAPDGGSFGPDPDEDNGRDLIYAGAGNDTVYGQDDDDTIFGGGGSDLLDGGVDDDSIVGGNGRDTIYGGQGADTMEGNAGSDEFRFDEREHAFGDEIDGGTEDGDGDPATDNENDQLDLRGLGRFEIVESDGTTPLDLTTPNDPDGNSFTGQVNFLDADGNIEGTLTFTEIEDIIPCFTPGTVIATPKGERLVEDLREGDKIITRDNGLQEIRWVGRRDLSGQELMNAPHLKPVLIRAGSLGHGLPERDMMVSPQHRLLINNDRTALYFEDREVLAAAKHLTGMEGVDSVEASSVSYIHFMFDQHEVVLSNGAWTESFQPGDTVLDAMGDAQRKEIYDLFPELAEKEGLNAYTAARRSLKKHEARLLVK